MEAGNPTAISVRFGHESLDMGLACFKGKDAASEEAKHAKSISLALYATHPTQIKNQQMGDPWPTEPGLPVLGYGFANFP